jgi:hypothetical protein
LVGIFSRFHFPQDSNQLATLTGNQICDALLLVTHAETIQLLGFR